MRSFTIGLGWLLTITFADAGQVKLVQQTPVELAGFGIEFQKLDFTFTTPVSARFWIEYDPGNGKPSRMDVPDDRVLPTDHYALSYLQLANNQVSVSVTTDDPTPTGRRSGGTGGDDGGGSRTVVYKPSTSKIELGKDLELFVATIKPPWRHPHDQIRIYKVMAHFSEAEFPIDPICLNDGASWQLVTKRRPAILRQPPNSFDWKDVSPPSLATVTKALPDESGWNDDFSLTAINANEAWLAVAAPLNQQPAVWIEHTTDGGKHWRKIETPATGEGVCLSFVDAQHGYLLALGSPATGKMKKDVYGTADGGAHWQLLASPGAGRFYPTGLRFRTSQEGWITGTYHGAPDVPLFHTDDGGKSWKLQTLDIPEDFRGGYADIYPPFFYPIYPELRKGQLPVKLVRHEPAPDLEKWVYFYTSDGGQTWHLNPDQVAN